MIEFPDKHAEAFTYPGGEVSVRFLAETLTPDQACLAVVTGADSGDLIALASWGQSVRRLGGRPFVLMPYLPAARADHADQPVGFDANIYADLISLAEPAGLVCIDPHSPVMPQILREFDVPTYEVALAPFVADRLAATGIAYDGLVIPDKGARGRVAALAERMGLPTYQAEKVRDFATGKLSGFAVGDDFPGTGRLLVADDICDGGGTFAGLAAAVAEGGRGVELDIWITHGIFSGRAAQNLSPYRRIHTTDSHPGHSRIPGAIVHPLLPTLLARLEEATQ